MLASTPLLYTTDSSYYSMIARLALIEKKIIFKKINLDIHNRLEQFKPSYVKLNPNLTIPTLIYGNTIVTSSYDILFFTDQLTSTPILQPSDSVALNNMHTLIALHYNIPIENFTFGKLLLKNPLLYKIIHKLFEKEMKLCQINSQQYPELKTAYRNKEKIILQRMLNFRKDKLPETFASGKNSILQFLEKLDMQLTTNKWAAGDNYSLADIVSTCLLARLDFSNEPSLYKDKPNLVRYYTTIKYRRSFYTANIWNRIHFSKIVSMLFWNLPLLFKT